MNESEYQRQIQQKFKEKGAKLIKIHGSAFTEKGTPDLIGVYKGFAIVIEAKVGTNKPSKIQEERLKEWQSVGAITFVARYPMHSADDVVEYIINRIRRVIYDDQDHSINNT